MLFTKTGRHGQALVMLEKLVQDQPQNPEHLKNLVSVLAQTGKTDRVSNLPFLFLFFLNDSPV